MYRKVLSQNINNDDHEEGPGTEEAYGDNDDGENHDNDNGVDDDEYGGTDGDKDSSNDGGNVGGHGSCDNDVTMMVLVEVKVQW